MYANNAILLLLVVSLIHSSFSTIGPSEKKAKKSKPAAAAATPTPITVNIVSEDETDAKYQPVDTSVTERGLVTHDLKDTKVILNNYKKYCEPCATKKQFPSTVLGYVTPWNNDGYTITKRFANKFSMISPVWLQVKRLKYKTYELTGTHDIDKGWMSDVQKQSTKGVEFVPRIFFEKWSPEDLHALFNNEDEMTELVKMLVDSANKYKFSGYVLEIYSQLHGNSKTHIAHLIKDLAKGLHESKSKKLVLVIPPALKTDDPKKQSENDIVFTKSDFELLQDEVDAFSLMTYDYASHSTQIAANAPIDWVRKNVEYFTNQAKYRSKILLGLNFYGMRYAIELIKKRNAQNAVEPIIGNRFIEMLKKYKIDIQYDAKSMEHAFFTLNTGDDKSLVFYPTLFSIQKRVELAQSLGTGLSIWELGQGLDYFYDLL